MPPAAPPAPAPSLPPPVCTSSQYSDALTDTVILALISHLESVLYEQAVKTEEEVRWVLDSLRELWTVDPQGGGLHFMFYVLEVSLSGGWDMAGLRAAKDLFGRSNFDPTKPAQARIS